MSQKSSKSYKSSEHPHRLPITLTRRVKQADVVTPPPSQGGSTDTAVAVAPLGDVEQTYYVHPEWKTPKATLPDAFERECGAVTEWVWTGEETMHPFWAVRRLSSIQLSQLVSTTPTGQLAPRFNCEIKVVQISNVNIASMRDKVMNRTRIFDVPFLTNSVSLTEGEELIMEIQKKRETAVTAKRATSIGLMKQQESQQKRQKKEGS